MNVQVTIPITVDGYTGQRDAWEEQTRDHVVTKILDAVILKQVADPEQKSITFRLSDLEKALTFLQEHQECQ